MRAPEGYNYLPAARVAELMMALKPYVKVRPVNRGLWFYDEQGRAIGGLDFKDDGIVDWWGPE